MTQWRRDTSESSRETSLDGSRPIQTSSLVRRNSFPLRGPLTASSRAPLVGATPASPESPMTQGVYAAPLALPSPVPNINVSHERFCLSSWTPAGRGSGPKWAENLDLPSFLLGNSGDCTRQTNVLDLERSLHYQSHLRRASRARKQIPGTKKEYDNEGK